MKEVEKKDENEVEKPDIPDVSGGLSYTGDCIPIPFEPYPWPDPISDPVYPIHPVTSVE